MSTTINNQKGISVIEILVAIAVLLISFIGIFGILVFSLKTSHSIKETTLANFLAQETIEAVRNFRDGTTWNVDGLGTLTTEVAYHQEQIGDTPPQWTLALGEEIINGFLRKVIFESVDRDANDNIVESGGTDDPETRKITVTVSWQDKNVEITTYLTNWR
ncbi:MAG TPA: hypothetical protein ENI19_00095 [Candidatus Nealsonbacteria bacterium]|uniref:Type IV pilus modification protein PilV n=1 Tax=marine sediment metagenome TaxID=412755 RepID=A0A0F9XDP4_9ZZZZ|nr:hypothetical protein [Candidatus Nealsonbacteria bacterium]HEB46107.1 hypothetical protein [Candidatus Nealsonbacteria bacterium]